MILKVYPTRETSNRGCSKHREGSFGGFGLFYWMRGGTEEEKGLSGPSVFDRLIHENREE